MAHTAEEAIKELTKQFGEGVIIRLNDKPKRKVPSISTGSLMIDRAIGGGIPIGRVTEISGPESAGKSTLGMHIVAEAQRQFPDKPAIFIDMEHALDKPYAEAIGVDIEELLFSQPERGTDALTIVKKMIPYASVIVVDSVPGLVTQAELDANPGDSHVGIQARLMSQHLREVVPSLGLSDAALVFINQLRMKIGVMFGCFHGDTLVAFADGSRLPIRTVVEKKLEGPILSFNEETGTIEPAKIINWFENGHLDTGAGEEWLQFIVNGPGTSNGKLGFACTPGHVLFRSDGSTACASDIEPGDELMSYREERILLDSVHHDIIFGSLLGDGTLRRPAVNTSCFSLANQEQPGYLLWKLQNLPMLLMRVGGNTNRPRWDSEHLVEFKVLRDQFYPNGNGYRQIPKELERLTPLMAAVWYMDDGTLKCDDTRKTPVPIISIKRLSDNMDQIEAAKKLLESLDRRLIGYVSYQESGSLLAISASVANVFFEIISRFVPPVMEYKLPEHLRGNYVKLEPRRVPSRLVPHPVTVLAKEPASKRKYRNTRKYDLQVEGNASYLVGGGTGVVVHNSPETRPGGRALKFWASLTLDIRRTGAPFGPKDAPTGHRIKVKAVKNKVFPPFRVAETNIIYGQGLSKWTDILALATEFEIIEKKGAYYYYKDENVAHGQVQGEAWVAKHPEIEKAVRAKLFGNDDTEEAAEQEPLALLQETLTE